MIAATVATIGCTKDCTVYLVRKIVAAILSQYEPITTTEIVRINIHDASDYNKHHCSSQFSATVAVAAIVAATFVTTIAPCTHRV